MIIISRDPSSQFPTWMNEDWYISSVNTPNGTNEPVIADVVKFQENGQVPPPTPWGTLDLNTVSPKVTEVSGVTGDGQPFHIAYEMTQVSCYIDPPPPGVLGKCVVLGTVGGVLIGGGVGLATGSLTLGVVAGSGSASLLTRLCSVQTDSARSGNATWVANDGGSSVVAAPQPLRVASA